MNNHTTIEKMKQMRLSGMAEAYHNNLRSSNYQDYTIDQYLAMLIDQEWEARQARKISGLVSRAKFKHQASIRDIDYSHPRDLDQNLFERLASLDFIKRNENIIITGPTGSGKSHLAQALGMHACHMLHKTFYFNTARFMDEINLSKLQGNYLNYLKKVQNSQLLILDDFGLTAIDQIQRQALLDIVEHKYDCASIIFTSQNRIELNGDSMRKNKLKK